MKKSFCFIRSVGRFGIICFQESDHIQKHYLFASQIIKSHILLKKFNQKEREYIKTAAEHESQDNWYQKAGEKLLFEGIAGFINRPAQPIFFPLQASPA